MNLIGGIEVKERYCPKCEKIYPLTAEHWHRNKNMKDGFAGHCKKCVNKSSRTEDISYDIKTEKELTFQGIPKVSMQLGHKYKFIIPAHGNDKKVEKIEGQVIQIENRHITFKHTLGFAETFLKWDLAQYKIKEV